MGEICFFKVNKKDDAPSPTLPAGKRNFIYKERLNASLELSS
jgi:hypothetical protein